jgi:hypothetical protein
MIVIRKLAAVDMAWLGPRIIIVEYTFGVLLPLALGLRSLRAGWPGLLRSGWVGILDVWLIGIGLNYIPLLIYAVLIARRGTVQQEGQPELASARRYGLQQVVILVPLMVVVLAIIQEVRRPY